MPNWYRNNIIHNERLYIRLARKLMQVSYKSLLLFWNLDTHKQTYSHTQTHFTFGHILNITKMKSELYITMITFETYFHILELISTFILYGSVLLIFGVGLFFGGEMFCTYKKWYINDNNNYFHIFVGPIIIIIKHHLKNWMVTKQKYCWL